MPAASLVILGLALTANPMPAFAQSRAKAAPGQLMSVQTNAPAAKAKKPVAGPFYGKLAALDKKAGTIRVGKRTFQITAKTRLHKEGKTATLDDAVVGEKCSGYVKPTENGKWVATTVNFGPKPNKQGAASKRSTKAPAAKAKKPVAGPFNGRLAVLDKKARTIKVGKRTFQITSKTKLRKDGKSATLEDAVVGERCSGYVKPTEGGKWLATTVNLGPKPKKQGAGTRRSSAKTQEKP